MESVVSLFSIERKKYERKVCEVIIRKMLRFKK